MLFLNKSNLNLSYLRFTPFIKILVWGLEIEILINEINKKNLKKTPKKTLWRFNEISGHRLGFLYINLV